MPWTVQNNFGFFAPGSFRVFFAPDDGAGAAGAVVDGEEGSEEDDDSEGDPQPADKPKWSEAQLQQMIQRRVAKANKEIEKRDAQIESLRKTLEELQESVGSGGDGDDPHEKGRLEVQLQKTKSRLAEVEAELQRAEKLREEAETKHRQGERDRMLQDALAEIQCTDPKRAARFFRDNLFFDQEEEEWVYQTESGGIVSIADGVAAECPDYWKPASLQGGSGTRSGSPKMQKVRGQIQEKKEKLKELEQKAVNTRANPGVMVQMRKLKKEIALLENELN